MDGGMNAEKLYDKNGCIGFIARKDGFWFIQENGSHVSMSDEDGLALLQTIRAEFVGKRSRYFATAIKWQLVSLIHRAMHGAYHFATALAWGKAK